MAVSSKLTEEAVHDLLHRLVRVSSPSALNVYDERACVFAGDPPGQATARLTSLRRYLIDHWNAPLALVGEAPGKNGARLSGIPFTSIRTLTGSGVAEPSATIVQRVLRELGVDQQVLLWNASMLFPPGNRDPHPEELSACRDLLRLVISGRMSIAVGRHAEIATGAPYIRHPANGGGREFEAGIRAVFESPPGSNTRDVLEALATPESPTRSAAARQQSNRGEDQGW
jgi:hypothetical protein